MFVRYIFWYCYVFNLIYEVVFFNGKNFVVEGKGLVNFIFLGYVFYWLNEGIELNVF